MGWVGGSRVELDRIGVVVRVEVGEGGFGYRVVSVGGFFGVGCLFC